MGDSIAHRGPDAEGYWVEPGLGLIHRRLSIIDLEGGDQPIGNEDGSIQIIFNGEIYNYQNLRRDLQNRGHRFQTQSDTEVLVHLYEEMGDRLAEKLRGMFAFALWDGPRRRLLLGRDHTGIKPLYLYRDAEKLLFGSELKAILAHPGVAREVNPAALEDYLAFGVVPGPRSIFRQIEKLPAGHTLSVQAGSWDHSAHCYWRLRLEPDNRPTADDWQEAIRAKLDESVRLNLVADVPVGAFLSGGIDSSIVVSLGAGRVAGPLETFSIGFNEEAYSELPYAREVADTFGTCHSEEIVAPDATDLLDDLTYYYDEPFADPSAIPTLLVSRLASRRVKVVLSGDGGDEAFGGYSRYAHDLREASLRRYLPEAFRRLVLSPVARAWPKADRLPRPLRAKTFLTNLSLDSASAYANTLMLCRDPLRKRLLIPEFRSVLGRHDPAQMVRKSFSRAPARDPLGGMIATDVALHLPDDYLVKVDRASMAYGLEVRPPLLDHELLELAARIPSGLKVRAGTTKWLLKQTYRRELPPRVLNRPKQGFEVPIDAWLRGPLREAFEATALSPYSPIGAFIDVAVVRQLYRQHLAQTGHHGAVLWALLVLAHWAERYLGPGAVGRPGPDLATHQAGLILR